MRQPFLLIKRDIRGKKVWYTKIWNEETHRYYWKSVPSIKKELGSDVSLSLIQVRLDQPRSLNPGSPRDRKMMILPYYL